MKRWRATTWLLEADAAVKMGILLLLVAAVFLGALLLAYMPTYERELLRDRQTSLRHKVEVVHSLLAEYHQRALGGELTLEEAQRRAVLRLQNLRYGQHDYFWINDATLPFPWIIMHPIIAGLRGGELDQERFNHASKMQYGVGGRIVRIPGKDKNLLQAFAEVVRESGDGYVTYLWPKPTPDGGTAEMYPKESYVKLFEPWGWVVGTGAYVDDIQARIVRLRWGLLAVAAAILSVSIVLLALFLAKFVTRPIASLMRYAERVSAGDWHAEAEGSFHAEAKRLKAVLLQMVGELEAAIRKAQSKEDEARSEAENALRANRKLDALFVAMREMVVVHELVLDERGRPANYRIVDCNRAFSETLGIARAAVVGRLATEVYGVPEAPYLDVYARVAQTGEPCRFETYLEKMDRHFSVSAVSPGKGQFATVSADVTESKRAQQAIDAKNKELERLVYVASHDLRSPLVNVDGYGREIEYAVGEIVRAVEIGDSPGRVLDVLRAQLPDMADALRHVRHSTKQMDALLKGLLRLSRMGRAALDVRTLAMNEVVARVLQTMDYQIGVAGAVVQVDDLPLCRADETQMAQVFSNLIGNALKFLDPARPGKIRIGGAVEKDRCVYWVRDNGIGIAPNQLEKIFDLFHRIDPENTEGDGLGLPTVRQILSRFDGRAWAESVPGEGSSFFVSLPKGWSPEPQNKETT